MASLQPQQLSLKLSVANCSSSLSLFGLGVRVIAGKACFCTRGLSRWIRGDYETASHAPPSLALAARFICTVPRWARDAVRTPVQPLERSQPRAPRRQRQAGCRTCRAGRRGKLGSLWCRPGSQLWVGPPESSRRSSSTSTLLDTLFHYQTVKVLLTFFFFIF